jgi:hypothetical protein
MSKSVDVRRFNPKGKDAFVTIVRTKPSNILDEVDKILNDSTLTETIIGSDGKPIQI